MHMSHNTGQQEQKRKCIISLEKIQTFKISITVQKSVALWQQVLLPSLESTLKSVMVIAFPVSLYSAAQYPDHEVYASCKMAVAMETSNI